MIKIEFKYTDHIGKMQDRIHKANVKTLKMIGGFTWKKERDLTRSNPKKVRPAGKPWRRRSGRLRDSMAFDVQENRNNVEIGFSKFVYTSELHEFGGIGKKNRKTGEPKVYPARPVIGPAFEKTKEQLRRKFPDIYRQYFE
jgi:phage gpG-like protein